MDKMENLITGDRLIITGNEKDFHGFEVGYMVKGKDAESTEITVKVLDEHIKQA